jgi:hypothetical protein
LQASRVKPAPPHQKFQGLGVLCVRGREGASLYLRLGVLCVRGREGASLYLRRPPGCSVCERERGCELVPPPPAKGPRRRRASGHAAALTPPAAALSLVAEARVMKMSLVAEARLAGCRCCSRAVFSPPRAACWCRATCSPDNIERWKVMLFRCLCFLRWRSHHYVCRRHE